MTEAKRGTDWCIVAIWGSPWVVEVARMLFSTASASGLGFVVSVRGGG